MNLAELRRRLWLFFNRDRAARDLEEEMRLHVEMRAQLLSQNSSEGTSEASARSVAQRCFGNTTSVLQRSHDAWGFGGAHELWSDVTFAWRRMHREKRFALSVIVVMAIGIGATIAIFSAVDAALLRPLPFNQPEDLAVLGVQVPGARPSRVSAAGRDVNWDDVVAMHDVFTSVSAYAAGGLNLSERDRSLRVKVGVVTANFFQTLRATPAFGRTFVVEEGKPGGEDAVVLSHALWQSHYGARDVTGMNVSLNDRTYRVVGVMPAGFNFPSESDLWIPLTEPRSMQTFEVFRDNVRTTTIARLADNVSMDQASTRYYARWKRLRTPQTASDSAHDRERFSRGRS